MRILLATLLALVASTTASAMDAGLRVVPNAPRSGTVVSPRSDGAAIDFGTVSNAGAAPSNGRRITWPDGSASLVATVVLEVITVGIDKALEPRLLGRSPLPSRRSGGRSAAPLDVLVDLFADLAEPLEGGAQVFVASPGFDWHTRPAPAVLGPHEILLATGLRPGDRVAYEIGLTIPATSAGYRQASVRFTVR